MILNLYGEDVRIDPLAIFSTTSTQGMLGIAYMQDGDKVRFYSFADQKCHLADPRLSIKFRPSDFNTMCENNWWKGVTCTFVDKKTCIGESGVLHSSNFDEQNNLRFVVMCGNIGRFPVFLPQISLTGHVNQDKSAWS